MQKQMPRRESQAQILMTECPLNTRCISRNFCDNNGMVTKTRHNDLLFENDRRGFIACVDSKKNVLGVCCVDLSVMLAGAGRPIRQDEVFTVESSIDEMKTTSRQTAATTPGPFVIINISADNADINGQVTDDPRVQTNTNINNINTRRPATRPRPSVPPDFLANNPFIGNGNDDDNISLSPTDVMAILDIMNDNRITNNNNNNNNNFGTASTPVFTTCPAATLCVDRSRCDFNGVITTNSISLNPRLASMQVALNRCTTGSTGLLRRRQGRQNSDMVCCRDPNKVKNDNDDDYDEFSDDFGDPDIEYSSYEIEDMDKIYMYNMKTPYQNESKDNKSEKLRRRKKKKKSQPLTSLQPPSKSSSRRKKGNRESLDFFTNG